MTLCESGSTLPRLEQPQLDTFSFLPPLGELAERQAKGTGLTRVASCSSTDLHPASDPCSQRDTPSIHSDRDRHRLPALRARLMHRVVCPLLALSRHQPPL